VCYAVRYFNESRLARCLAASARAEYIHALAFIITDLPVCIAFLGSAISGTGLEEPYRQGAFENRRLPTTKRAC
jgi:hypothetical protein